MLRMGEEGDGVDKFCLIFQLDIVNRYAPEVSPPSPPSFVGMVLINEMARPGDQEIRLRPPRKQLLTSETHSVKP